ncbi:hypothetical protein Tco_0790933 [Tanacetum coccineum]
MKRVGKDIDQDSICKPDVDSEEDQEEDGDNWDIFYMWDIMTEDVERIRKFFNVPNEIDEIVQPLIPELIHTTPPNADYVAPATKLILDELLEEFGDEILNVTIVDNEADFNPTKDLEELERLLAKEPQSNFTEIQVHSVIMNNKPFIHTQLMSPLYGVFKTSKPCKVDRDIISPGSEETKFEVTSTRNYVVMLLLLQPVADPGFCTVCGIISACFASQIVLNFSALLIKMTLIARGHDGDGGADPAQSPGCSAAVASIDRHLAGLREEDIKRSIKDYFSKWYSGNKNKYKDVMWTNKGGLAAADQIRRERPENVTHDNWNKLVDFWIDPKRAHMAEVNSRNKMVNKIVSLQGSRSLARSRHKYVVGVGTSTVFKSQDEGTPFYSQREMNENQGMSQLATMFPGSTTEVGSMSGTAFVSGDPSPSRNVDPSSSGSLDGDDEDDGDV